MCGNHHMKDILAIHMNFSRGENVWSFQDLLNLHIMDVTSKGQPWCDDEFLQHFLGLGTYQAQKQVEELDTGFFLWQNIMTSWKSVSISFYLYILCVSLCCVSDIHESFEEIRQLVVIQFIVCSCRILLYSEVFFSRHWWDEVSQVPDKAPVAPPKKAGVGHSRVIHSSWCNWDKYIIRIYHNI